MAQVISYLKVLHLKVLLLKKNKKLIIEKTVSSSKISHCELVKMASAAEVIGSVKSGPFSMLVSELLCPCMVTGGSDKGWSFSFDGLC